MYDADLLLVILSRALATHNAGYEDATREHIASAHRILLGIVEDDAVRAASLKWQHDNSYDSGPEREFSNRAPTTVFGL